jgi:GTP-binding protein
LAEERLAVIDDVPGTTRDRLFAESEWAGFQFIVVDTGGIDSTQAGPGGNRQPLSIGSADFIQEIRAQATIAIQEADVVLLITDAESGVTTSDHEIAQYLRQHQVNRQGEMYPPVLLVVNKADNARRRERISEFYELGLGEPHPISAYHGTGTGDLLDVVVSYFKKVEEIEEDDTVKIAIVGKPNVGKSSLLNKLLGQERAIVSPIPGTTRDAIDTYLEYEGIGITLIDTAGIRRRGRIEPGVEKFSVLRSLRAIERADLALLIVDATSGLTAQDAHIAGFILDSWKSAVIVVNKWDAIQKDNHSVDVFTRQVRQELNFLDYAPILFISAKTGQRVDQVLPLALRVQEERLVNISTSQLNQILQRAQDQHPAPSHAGRQLRIYYGTQVRNDPPTFLLYVNDPKLAHFTYHRFLENRLREVYPFLGTPVRFIFRSHHP